jgi:hypothetical protein
MFILAYDLVQSTNEIKKLKMKTQQLHSNFHICKKLAIENPTDV